MRVRLKSIIIPIDKPKLYFELLFYHLANIQHIIVIKYVYLPECKKDYHWV